MAKRSGRAKSDIVIKAKTTSFRIIDIGPGGIRAELTTKGTVTGKYRASHWDTVDMQMNPDGTSSWQVKWMQVTDRGELLAGTGGGTGEAPSSKGIAKLKGEGTLMTESKRLSELTGGKWSCEVDNYVVADRAVVFVKF
jgi:hypothetical protein